MTVVAPRGDRAVPAADGDAVPVLRLEASPVTAPDPILLMAAAVAAGEEAALWMRPADGSAIVRKFGQKSAEKLTAQIERSKSNELWRLLFGLGIRHIGERASHVLARALGSMDAIAEASRRRISSGHCHHGWPSPRACSAANRAASCTHRSWRANWRSASWATMPSTGATWPATRRSSPWPTA